jgi:hypothetical protein
MALEIKDIPEGILRYLRDTKAEEDRLDQEHCRLMLKALLPGADVTWTAVGLDDPGAA